MLRIKTKKPRQSRVRAGKEMVVDLTLAGVVEITSPEVSAWGKGHMTFGAPSFGFGRIIETPRSMAGNAAQKKRIMMILPTQELLIVIHGKGNADFVASGAKLSRAMERFKEGLPVKIRLGFHELIIDPLQDGILTVCERIVQRFLDGVVGIAGRAIDVRNRMTDRTSNAGVGGGMVGLVKVFVVELAREKGNGVMTAGTPARRSYFAVALKRDFSGFIDAEFVRRI